MVNDSLTAIKDFPDITTDKKELSVVSKEISKSECDKIKIWDKLKNALSKTDNGVGLAGIQIGYPVRVALAVLEDKGKKYQHCLLNPKIIEKSKVMVKFKKEGCLSFPGEYVNTIRHQWVKVEDELNGIITYTGFEAIVVQHEMEHMDGRTMFDSKIQDAYVRDEPKIGRNDKCPCGSGKKYKKCCGK